MDEPSSDKLRDQRPPSREKMMEMYKTPLAGIQVTESDTAVVSADRLILLAAEHANLSETKSADRDQSELKSQGEPEVLAPESTVREPSQHIQASYKAGTLVISGLTEQRLREAHIDLRDPSQAIASGDETETSVAYTKSSTKKRLREDDDEDEAEMTSNAGVVIKKPRRNGYKGYSRGSRTWTAKQRESFKARQLQKTLEKDRKSDAPLDSLAGWTFPGADEHAKQEQSPHAAEHTAASSIPDATSQQASFDPRQSSRSPTRSRITRLKLGARLPPDSANASDVSSKPADLSFSNLKRLNEELSRSLMNLTTADHLLRISENGADAPHGLTSEPSVLDGPALPTLPGANEVSADEHDHQVSRRPGLDAIPSGNPSETTLIRSPSRASARLARRPPTADVRQPDSLPTSLEKGVRDAAAWAPTSTAFAQTGETHHLLPTVADGRQDVTTSSGSRVCPMCQAEMLSLDVSEFRQHVWTCVEERGASDLAMGEGEEARDSVVGADTGTLWGRSSAQRSSQRPEELRSEVRSNLSSIAARLTPIDSESEASGSDRHVTLDGVEHDDFPSAYTDDGAESREEEGCRDGPPLPTFRKLTDPAKLLAALESPEERSTEMLYDVLENVAEVLKVWQVEWTELEKTVAINSHREARDPRAPMDPVVFDDQKEAALYGYRWDPNPAKKGMQDPTTQKRGTVVGGKELRNRMQSLKRAHADSGETGEVEGTGRGRPKRARAAAMDAGSMQDAAQSGRESSRATRLRAVRPAGRDAGTPDASDAPRRRGRPRINRLPSRVQDLRQAPSGASTETEMAAATPPPPKRRGRPPKKATASAAGSQAGNVARSRPPAATAAKRVRAKMEEDVDADSEGPKKRTKSAKRSAAMQLWWNKRKGLTAAQQGPAERDDGNGGDVGGGSTAAASPASQQALELAMSANPAPARGPPVSSLTEGRSPTKVGSGPRRPQEGTSVISAPAPTPSSTITSTANGAGASAASRGDGLTEFERFQRLSNGDVQGGLGGKRKRASRRDADELGPGDNEAGAQPPIPPLDGVYEDDLEEEGEEEDDFDDDGADDGADDGDSWDGE
ncbi:MAG: hypothetical protein M1838_003286 [Thelocarpon superellum]|nr:MAG: hypothetical protein M1838_003286 [Thelocarpon superellum]